MKNKSKKNNLHSTLPTISITYSSPKTKKQTHLPSKLSNTNPNIQKSPFSLFVEQELSPLPCPNNLNKINLPQMIIYKTPEKNLFHYNHSINIEKIANPLNFEYFNMETNKIQQTYSQKQQDQHDQENSYQRSSQSNSQNKVISAEQNQEHYSNLSTNINSFKRKIQLNQKKQIQNGHNDTKLCCNCKKSRCLKLYCDCFRNNQLCKGCNCVECLNATGQQQQRYNAILILIQKNPDAFKPKIQIEKHTKGCNCKKSNCLKKYCECYQAGLKCCDSCRCEQCKNGKNKDNKQMSNKKGQVKDTIKKQGRYLDWIKQQIML